MLDSWQPDGSAHPDPSHHRGTDPVAVAPQRQRPRATLVVAVLAAILTAVTGTVAKAALGAQAGAGSTCRVVYTITSQWPGGFGTDLTVVNTSATALTSWNLTWSFANGQTVYQHWGTDLDQNGPAVTATSEPNEGFIAARGGTFHLGFLGHWSGTNATPTAFKLSGTPCSVSAPTAATPTPAPSTAAAGTRRPPATTTRSATGTARPTSPAQRGGTPAGSALPAGTTCAAIYEIETQWPAGGHRAFQSDIQIVNLTPSVLTSWTFGWTFPDDQTIYQSWGADVSQSGRTVTAKSEPNEGWINGQGGRFHLGFLGNVTSTNTVPTAFTFNGKACPLVDDNLRPVAKGDAAALGAVSTVRPGAPAVTPAVTTSPAASTAPTGSGGLPKGASTVTGCRAVYEVETSWPTATGRAFLADVQIVNTSRTALDTWSFTWSFPGNQSVYQFWGVDLAQSGRQIRANSEPFEGHINPGQSFHLGFLANYTGANDVPANFALNGTPCPVAAG